MNLKGASTKKSPSRHERVSGFSVGGFGTYYGDRKITIGKLPSNPDEIWDFHDPIAPFTHEDTNTSCSEFKSPEGVIETVLQVQIPCRATDLSPAEVTQLSFTRGLRFLEPWKEHLLEHCKKSFSLAERH